MIEPQYKYDFPKGHSDPFEPIDDHGNFFVYANAHSNLGNLDDFSRNVLEENIPMGYKSIVVCQRIVLISKGKVVRKWPEEMTIPKKGGTGKYFVTTNKPYEVYVKNWDRMHETMDLYNATESDGLPWSTHWDDLDECVRAGEKHSRQKGSDVVISYILDWIGWH